MAIPLQISFRHMKSSGAVEAKIEEKVAKLERFFDRIMGCRVVVEAPRGRRGKGGLYRVRIDLSVPYGKLVVSREKHDNPSHEDIYVALRDSFSAMQRQLESYVKRLRRDVKSHEAPASGRITALIPEKDCGFLETLDGREIYFHRNSVIGDRFDKLTLGCKVYFVEVEGEKGPQASTVKVEI